MNGTWTATGTMAFRPTVINHCSSKQGVPSWTSLRPNIDVAEILKSKMGLVPETNKWFHIIHVLSHSTRTRDSTGYHILDMDCRMNIKDSIWISPTVRAPTFRLSSVAEWWPQWRKFMFQENFLEVGCSYSHIQFIAFWGPLMDIHLKLLASRRKRQCSRSRATHH